MTAPLPDVPTNTPTISPPLRLHLSPGADCLPLHDVAGTRQLEQYWQARLPAHSLMQRAGLAVARLALALAPHARLFWIVCGPGNNGGDGLQAAAFLRQWGRAVCITLLAQPADLPADARQAWQAARHAGAEWLADGQAPVLTPTDLCIDALLGIGTSHRPPSPQMAQHMAHMQHSAAPILAVDIPSGLQADTGCPISPPHGVRAQHTLCLLTLKPGLFTAHGRDHAGTIWLHPLLDAHQPHPTTDTPPICHSALLYGAHAGIPHPSHAPGLSRHPSPVSHAADTSTPIRYFSQPDSTYSGIPQELCATNISPLPDGHASQLDGAHTRPDGQTADTPPPICHSSQPDSAHSGIPHAIHATNMYPSPSGHAADTQPATRHATQPDGAYTDIPQASCASTSHTPPGRHAADTSPPICHTLLSYSTYSGIPPTIHTQGTHPRLPPHASHKGVFGDVCILGGAAGMTGAALLAGTAALHAGAGRVYVGLLHDGPHSLPAAPELMLHTVAPPPAAGTTLPDWPTPLPWRTATVAAGCGGGSAIAALLPVLLAHSPRLVLDADALNAIATCPTLQQLLRQRGQRQQGTILTPHPLEAARLLGCHTSSVQADRLRSAQQLADDWQAVVVLKGSGSIVAMPAHLPQPADATAQAGADGTHAGTYDADAHDCSAYQPYTSVIHYSGNALLATAGTGDVLAGCLAACWAQQAAWAAGYRNDGAVRDIWDAWNARADHRGDSRHPPHPHAYSNAHPHTLSHTAMQAMHAACVAVHAHGYTANRWPVTQQLTALALARALTRPPMLHHPTLPRPTPCASQAGHRLPAGTVVSAC